MCGGVSQIGIKEAKRSVTDLSSGEGLLYKCGCAQEEGKVRMFSGDQKEIWLPYDFYSVSSAPWTLKIKKFSNGFAQWI